MRVSPSIVLIAALLVAPCILPVQGGVLGDADSPPHYTVTEMKELVDVRGFNNKGQAVGLMFPTPPSKSETQAFVWSKQGVQMLPTVPGAESAIAVDINDKGDVVGWATMRDGKSQAVCWIRGKLKVIKSPVSYPYAYASHINSSGVILCTASTDDSLHPIKPVRTVLFLYRDGKVTPLHLKDELIHQFKGINSKGVIVGTHQIKDDGPWRAVFWEGKELHFLMKTFGGKSSEGTGINDRGEIVGNADTPNGDAHGFIYSKGEMRDISALEGSGISVLNAINNHGTAVGYAAHSRSDDKHEIAGFIGPPNIAILYYKSKVYRLDKLVPPGFGWSLVEGTHINDKGQIVAGGIRGEDWHQFLLTPVVRESR
jgi:probable HAF family extracellular repeat protein